MSIFSRISDIIGANINALLDKAENPERMIAQIIREMEEALANARRSAAKAVVAERQVGRELEQNQGEVVHWKAKAREALAAGREDLARQALLRKKEHDDLVRGLEANHAAAAQTSESVKTSLRALEARLAEARRKQRSLIARHSAAKVRVQVQRTVFPDPSASLAKFDRLESRLIEQTEEITALADLSHCRSDVEGEFAEWHEKTAVDEELAALKKEMNINGVAAIQ